MKLPNYTEAALLAHGIPFAERGTVPPNSRSRERKAFIAKWATFQKRGDHWLVHNRQIVPEAEKAALTLQAYRDPKVGST